jgi:2-oxo-4-hydroxy-4-carboxy--5-ureidoimidazoline (OHCU) decarboxylase
MYVVKKNKRKIKINKQKGNKQTNKNKQKLQKKFIRQFGSVFNKKKWLNP